MDTSSTSEEVAGLKTDDDGIFTLDGKNYRVDAFLQKEICLGKISKVFQNSQREKNMGISLKPDDKNKNWRDGKNNRINLKAVTTKSNNKLEEVDDSKIVFSDLTFTVAAYPAQVQTQSTRSTSAIPEDPTIKGIFSAAGAWMKMLATTTTRNTETLPL